MGFAVFAADFWRFGPQLAWGDLVSGLEAEYGKAYLPQSAARWASIREQLADDRGVVSKQAFVSFCGGPVGQAVLETFAQAESPERELSSTSVLSPAPEPAPCAPSPFQVRLPERVDSACSVADGDVTFRAPPAPAVIVPRSGFIDERESRAPVVIMPRSGFVDERESELDDARRFEDHLDSDEEDDFADLLAARVASAARAPREPDASVLWPAAEADSTTSPDRRGACQDPKREQTEAARPRAEPRAGTRADKSPFAGRAERAEKARAEPRAEKARAEPRAEKARAEPRAEKARAEPRAEKARGEPRTPKARAESHTPKVRAESRSPTGSCDARNASPARWPLSMLHAEADGEVMRLSWSASAWHRDDDDQEVRVLLYRCTCDPGSGERVPDSLVEVELPPGSTSFEDQFVDEGVLYGYLLLGMRGPEQVASPTVFAHL